MNPGTKRKLGIGLIAFGVGMALMEIVFETLAAQNIAVVLPEKVVSLLGLAGCIIAIVGYFVQRGTAGAAEERTQASAEMVAWSVTLLMMLLYGFIVFDIFLGTAGDPQVVAYALSGILGAGVLGAFLVRFRSAQMVYVLLAMALMQGLAAVLALTLMGSSLPETLLVSGLLIAGLLAAGFLFRKAAAEKAPF